MTRVRVSSKVPESTGEALQSSIVQLNKMQEVAGKHQSSPMWANTSLQKCKRKHLHHQVSDRVAFKYGRVSLPPESVQVVVMQAWQLGNMKQGSKKYAGGLKIPRSSYQQSLQVSQNGSELHGKRNKKYQTHL